MPIKWKSSQRFKPAVVLARIDKARTVSGGGGASFTGFGWEECLPTLHSMLTFPLAAREIDASTLVWKALTKVRGPLTPADFLRAANSELTTLLATKEEQYRLLTLVSVRKDDIPATLSCLGAKIRFFSGPFPARYKAHDELISRHPTGIPQDSPTYTRVIVSVMAKSPHAAFSKAMWALDLQRAFWCLMGNLRMQITYGTPSFKPINVVRLSGYHTLHHADGRPAHDGVWFEPGYVEAPLFAFKNALIVRKKSLWALRQIRSSVYRDQITSALVRYVRALDESDADAAFLRLWTAIEALTTPGVADYEKLVRRCTFLFQDGEFHRQTLEHLREYRNGSVHRGEQSGQARMFCFQLQLYFNVLIWFHIRNAKFFRSVEEANQFLDTPPDKATISRQVTLAKRALRFIMP